MVHQDWIKQIIAHRPAAVPYNFSFTPPAAEKLRRHFQTAYLPRFLAMPIRSGKCWSIKPQYASPRVYGFTIIDEFGVKWSTSDIDRGSPVRPALPEANLAGYTFPDPADPARFEHLADWSLQNRQEFRLIWVGDLWERATFMRGMENLLLDVALAPHFVRQLLRRLADYILQTMQILCDRFEFEAVALSDDYGSQHGMLISPGHWRELIRPLLAEIINYARSRGRYTFLHSCGNISLIVSDLVDLGLDILHPIQPEAMDIFELKREFGRDITFCGGLATQQLLNRGTPDMVRAEIRKLKEIMGDGGGYILEPGITIQADVPLENMLAMIEEAQRA